MQRGSRPGLGFHSHHPALTPRPPPVRVCTSCLTPAGTCVCYHDGEKSSIITPLFPQGRVSQQGRIQEKSP